MAENFRSRFEFDPVRGIEPWGTVGDDSGPKSLSWFGLTSGHYWSETPAGPAVRGPSISFCRLFLSRFPATLPSSPQIPSGCNGWIC